MPRWQSPGGAGTGRSQTTNINHKTVFEQRPITFADEQLATSARSGLESGIERLNLAIRDPNTKPRDVVTCTNGLIRLLAATGVNSDDLRKQLMDRLAGKNLTPIELRTRMVKRIGGFGQSWLAGVIEELWPGASLVNQAGERVQPQVALYAPTPEQMTAQNREASDVG